MNFHLGKASLGLPLAILALGCVFDLFGNGDGPEAAIDPFSSKGDFKVVGEYAEIIAGYRSKWTRLTGFEFSGLHWGHFIVIYVDRNPETYLYNYTEYEKHYWDDEFDEFEESEDGPGFREYEVGTVFLKEHFVSENGKPGKSSFLALMTKEEPGYDDAFGNWKYAWLDGSNGSAIAIGNSSNETLMGNCIECHTNMADRDYIFSTHSAVIHVREPEELQP